MAATCATMTLYAIHWGPSEVQSTLLASCTVAMRAKRAPLHLLWQGRAVTPPQGGPAPGMRAKPRACVPP